VDEPVARAAITFIRDVGGDAEVYTMDQSGGTQRRLTHRLGLETDPTWSPDGSRIAWTRGPDGLGGTNQLWLMNADGTSKDRIYLDRAFRGDVSDPTWSPDGERLVFTTNRTLHLINADGSGLRRLIATDMAAGRADWSPDGAWIAFSGRTTESSPALWFVRPDGSDLHQVRALPGGVSWPEWSPDGERIAYLTLHNLRFSLGIMRRDGTGARHIVDGVQGWGAVWSPFGKRLLFTATDPDGTVGLYRSNRRGGAVQAVGQRPGVHAYNPDYRPAPAATP
jgi:Tol biopolymer transport system component